MLDFLLKNPEEREKERIIARVKEVLSIHRVDLSNLADRLFSNIREIQSVGWTRGNRLDEVKIEISRNWERQRREIDSLIGTIVMIIDRLDTEIKQALQGR